MRSSIRTSALLMAFFCLLARAEEPDFQVYQAQSRSAEELKKAAADVLNGGRVTTSGSQVILYGTKSQRDSVLRLFSQLDHELQNFVVRFRLAKHGSRDRDAGAVRAGVRGQGISAQARSGVDPGRGGGAVSAGGASASVASGSGSGDSDAGEYVTVADGGTGRLYAGNDVFAKGVSIEVHSIGRSAGARLEIRELDLNGLGEQSLVTEANVPLGEWRSLGGVVSSGESHVRDMFGASRRSSLSVEGVQVKVDIEK